MKKLLIATAALSLMCGSAFAQDSMHKSGMNNGSMEKGSMEKGSMKKGSMTKGATTGMNNGGMANDPNAMPNKDATGQGTVGPDSKGGMMKK